VIVVPNSCVATASKRPARNITKRISEDLSPLFETIQSIEITKSKAMEEKLKAMQERKKRKMAMLEVEKVKAENDAKRIARDVKQMELTAKQNAAQLEFQGAMMKTLMEVMESLKNNKK
jgi:hypothetical protein